jgi:hypothetical protein
MFDKLLGEVDHFFIGRSQGDFVMVIRRFAQLVSEPQHLYDKSILERRNPNQPLATRNGQLRKANFTRLARSIANDGITLAGHLVSGHDRVQAQVEFLGKSIF